MMRHEELTLVFRDQRTGNHSIERLFNAIEPVLAGRYKITKVTIPHRPSTPLGLLKNVLHARRQVRGVIHVTGDAQYLAAFLPSGRVVLTIHDCGYLMKLRGLKRWLFLWLWYRLPCWRAACITTISQSTKEVLEREVGLSPEKIRVIDNCVTGKFDPTSRVFASDRPKILQIGSGSHKNLDTLIQAVKGMNCELMIVGKVCVDNKALLERYKVPHRIEFDVSDQRLREIYGDCDILFFASRHEGFGLPIIEAQTAGIPVITSNVYSMPYVAGDGALLVDPESAGEIRNAIQKITSDVTERERLLLAGFKNIERFSVASVAGEYMNAYQGIID